MREHDRPRLSTVAAMLLAAALTGWMGWRHVGPYRWLAETQADGLDGRYDSAISASARAS